MGLLAEAAAAIGSVPDADVWQRVLRSAQAEPAEPADIAALARALASSGERLPHSSEAADVASTGGPGSLSTLLTSSQLVACGWSVPKISVPGRPAGGVDALGSLPGYDVRLTRKAAEAALDSCGHAHILAGGIWAPADAALFAIRQREGAQQVPALAAASLLAKKLAAGAGHVALDVRVAPHGNFGANVHDARAAARMFVRAAEIAGINAVCLLSDASGVQQPWLGRGEALAAVRRVLDGEAEGSLAWHADDCASIAAAIAGTPSALDAARDAFHRNLTAQGTSPEVWRARAQSVEGATRMPIAAPGEGYLRIDISRVRDALVDAQRRSPRPLYSLFPDPAGLVLAAMPGEAVVSGQPVAHLRAAGDDATALARTVAEAFSVSDFPPAPRASWHGESVE